MSMSRHLTFVTLMLTAVVAFLVGAIFAGGATRTAVVSSAPRTAPPKPTTRPATMAVSPLVSFADVVERINPAVVNIDATSRAPDPRRRRGRSLAPDPPDLFSDPFDFGGRGDREPTRRGA